METFVFIYTVLVFYLNLQQLLRRSCRRQDKTQTPQCLTLGEQLHKERLRA